MAVLTLTLTVPDSHQTMIDKLGINAAKTQVDRNSLMNLMAEVVDGAQKVSTLVVDLDGTVTVTNPAL